MFGILGLNVRGLWGAVFSLIIFGGFSIFILCCNEGKLGLEMLYSLF